MFWSQFVCDHCKAYDPFTFIMFSIYSMFSLMTLCFFRYMEFFNITYNNTETSKWNIDDGYSSYSDDDILVDSVPSRTNGVSYYHRLKLFLFSNDDEFVNCPNSRLTDFFFVSIIQWTLSPCIYCVLLLIPFKLRYLNRHEY